MAPLEQGVAVRVVGRGVVVGVGVGRSEPIAVENGVGDLAVSLARPLGDRRRRCSSARTRPGLPTSREDVVEVRSKCSCQDST